MKHQLRGQGGRRGESGKPALRAAVVLTSSAVVVRLRTRGSSSSTASSGWSVPLVQTT
nr:hypothetical protein [Humisphaera borealis]